MGQENHKHRWGVILAGGDGTRLKTLTRAIAGDDRPKQFCPLVGGKTLLDQTQRRVFRRLNPARTCSCSILNAILRFESEVFGPKPDGPPLFN